MTGRSRTKRRDAGQLARPSSADPWWGKTRGAEAQRCEPTNPIARLPALWRGKVIARALFLIVVAALLAAAAAAFGIAHDYGYLHASIPTGSPGGQYQALATRLSERA